MYPVASDTDVHDSERFKPETELVRVGTVSFDSLPKLIKGLSVLEGSIPKYKSNGWERSALSFKNDHIDNLKIVFSEIYWQSEVSFPSSETIESPSSSTRNDPAWNISKPGPQMNGSELTDEWF